MNRSETDETRVSDNERHFSTTRVKEDLRRKTVAGAAVTLTAQIGADISQLIGSIILARFLKPDDFGLVLMVAAFSVLLMNFGVNGFTEVIIQKDDLRHGQVNTLFWINLACSGLLALVFMALGPVIAGFYGEPELIPIAVAMALSILFAGLSTQHIAILKRNMKFHAAVGSELAALILSYALAIGLALNGFGYWALVARQVLFTFLLSLGGWILCSWRPGLPAWAGGMGSLLKYAVSTYGTFAMTYFQRNLDKVLIGRFLGTQSLGSYDRAYTLFALPASQLTVPLTNVSLAALSRLRQDPQRYRHAYLKALSLVAFLGMPLSALLTVIGYDLILLLLGPNWEQAGLIFTVFAPSAGVFMIYSTHGWLHLSLGRADNWLRWSIVAFVVTAGFFIAGLPYGAPGVALGRVVAIHVLALPGIWYAGKPIGLRVVSVLHATWRCYASSFMAGLSTWVFLKNIIPPAPSFEVYALRVFAGSSICVLLYLVFTVVINQGTKPIADFFGILRESIGGLRQGSRA
ncbi:MAG: lipopolysaccharide biosynthesis protein [Deltaproteobacteria bacterium HGW-Deltaproteobacteria-15]|nr:MAG: lipopolysaccharide biosynthesis protein [Deltaproteobacteria bacterium HGW-Deltaproteobacteria-15]